MHGWFNLQLIKSINELKIHTREWISNQLYWMKEVKKKRITILWFNLYKILENSNKPLVSERRSMLPGDWGERS